MHVCSTVAVVAVMAVMTVTVVVAVKRERVAVVEWRDSAAGTGAMTSVRVVTDMSQLANSSCRLEGATATGSQGPSVWQKLTVTCVALTAGVSMHIFAFHLHDILVPFFLSGIIVFALQPACEYIYCLFAGLIPPFRWCVVCSKRRSVASDRADAERRKPRDSEDDAYACCWGGETAKDVQREHTDIIRTDRLGESIPTLAVMFADGLIRLFAVLCVLGMLMLIVLFFFYLLGHGAMQLKDNWSAYRNGLARLKELEHQIVDQLSNDFHMEHSVDRDLKMVYDKILERASEVVWEVVNEIVRNVTEEIGRAHV